MEIALLHRLNTAPNRFAVRRRRSMFMRLLCGALAVVMVDSLGRANAQPADPFAPYRAQRDAFVDAFRVDGRIDCEQLAPVASGLAALVRSSSGETQARALLELGTVQRLGNDFPGAVATLSQAAQTAESLGLRDVAFQAWIGVARAHEYGTSDHGAAAIAFERAVDAAGEQPTAQAACRSGRLSRAT